MKINAIFNIFNTIKSLYPKKNMNIYFIKAMSYLCKKIDIFLKNRVSSTINVEITIKEQNEFHVHIVEVHSTHYCCYLIFKKFCSLHIEKRLRFKNYSFKVPTS